MADGPPLAVRVVVDGDVHGGPAGADFLADEEHRRFVHLAFADHHGAVDIHRVEGLTHRFHRRAVGVVLLAEPDPAGRGERGRFGDPHQFEGEVAVGVGRHAAIPYGLVWRLLWRHYHVSASGRRADLPIDTGLTLFHPSRTVLGYLIGLGPHAQHDPVGRRLATNNLGFARFGT